MPVISGGSMKCFGRFYFVVVIMRTMRFGLLGCGKSNSSGGGSPHGSGTEKAAQENALAEIKKRWVKQSEGWITTRDSGSSFAPIRFLRQCRELTVEGVR